MSSCVHFRVGMWVSRPTPPKVIPPFPLEFYGDTSHLGSPIWPGDENSRKMFRVPVTILRRG